MILAAMLLAAMGPAQAAPIAADPANAPKVAPSIPLVAKGAEAGEAKAPVRTDALSALADGDAPEASQAADWKSIPDAKRRMLIMGSIDGFTIAGDRAPCFSGRSPEDIDRALIAAGFGDKSPERLPEAMGFVSDGKAGCPDAVTRTYDTAHLFNLPEESLALYLTGAIRAYARIQPCPSDAQSYAALLTIGVLRIAEPGTNPIAALKASVVEGCASQKAG